MHLSKPTINITGIMRTSNVKTPATVHPILCVSQCHPLGDQKVDWSIFWVLSDGQRIGVLLVIHCGVAVLY